MVVFGAGASYDSCATYQAPDTPPRNPDDDDVRRPPLANDLFQNRWNFENKVPNTPVSEIIKLLRFRGAKSVEEVLQELQTRSKTFEDDRRDTIRRQLLGVRYYLREVLAMCTNDWNIRMSGDSNYRTLLNSIEMGRNDDGPVLLATFNYDLLLDYAVTDSRFQIRSMSDYTHGHPRRKLFKLHGSVNWGHDVGPSTDMNNRRQFIIDHPPDPEINYPFVLCDGYDFVLSRDGRDVFPALAIPMREKDAFECPAEHLTVLRADIPRVRRIIFIGWSASETHFLKELTDGLRTTDDLRALESFLVVSSRYDGAEIAAKVRDALGDVGRNARALIGKGGFTHFIRSDECDDFLIKRYDRFTSL